MACKELGGWGAGGGGYTSRGTACLPLTVSTDSKNIVDYRKQLLDHQCINTVCYLEYWQMGCKMDCL